MIALIALLLVAGSVGAGPRSHSRPRRILLVVTVAEVIGTTALILNLLTTPERISEMPHTTALILLRDAALLWLVNILTFLLSVLENRRGRA